MGTIIEQRYHLQLVQRLGDEFMIPREGYIQQQAGRKMRATLLYERKGVHAR